MDGGRTNVETLADEVRRVRAAAGRPVVVGVSGFCGSGKSTLTRALVGRLPGAVRMRGDDFLDPALSHARSDDWSGVDRVRLRDTVLEPFRASAGGSFRRYDWSARGLGRAERLPGGEVLVVDLIGLFHPETLPSVDLTVWCDLDLETAAVRGQHRDRVLGRDHERLWNDVWVPNERDFAARFDPRAAAAVLVSTR